jgi:hypothetical protein
VLFWKYFLDLRIYVDYNVPLLGGIACSRVYDHYKSFCDADGYLPMNTSNFGKEVKRLFPLCERMNVRLADKREKYYRGLLKE